MNILTIHDVTTVTTTPWEEKNAGGEGSFADVQYGIQRIIIETENDQFVIELFKYPKKEQKNGA